MDMLTVVEDLRERVAPLLAANVQRLEVATDGRVLLEGEEFALLLGPRAGRASFSLIEPVAPPAPEPAQLHEPEPAARRTPAPTPKARTDERAAELVEARRATGDTEPRSKAPHGGRHVFRDGHCEKDGCRACEKCRAQMWNRTATDEYGDADPHCTSCGSRPTRQPTPEEADPNSTNGKQRRRDPSFNGMKL